MISTASRISNVEEYYFSKKLAEVRSLDSPDFRTINLGIGSPDMPPSPETIEAMITTAKLPFSHGYQSYKGIPALRQAIADFYERVYKAKIDAESMILPLMGSKEGIMHITMAFVNEGETVLVPDPGYPTYSSVAKLVGAKIANYPHKESLGWSIDMEALRKMDLSRVKLMWINFPHMPTGKIATMTELSELVSLAKENNFLIVNDNPYSLILNDHPISILSVPGAEEVALELNSLSKSHNMAGWRVGWVAGRKEYIDAVLRVKSNMDSGMFLGIQQAAVKALALGEDWFNKLNDEYRKRRAIAGEIMDLLGCAFDKRQAGLFVWAKVPDHIVDVEKWIDEILYATKVFITPGFIFGETGKRFIRISLCSTEEVLREAFSRLGNFLKERESQDILTAKR